MKSDEELLLRVRAHSESALQELLVRYYTRLGEFSFSLLRRRDLAEEAVLNVFLQLWRRRESLVVNGLIRNYLFAAVGNQCLNLRKQQRRHETVWIDDVPQSELIDSNRAEDDLLYKELHAQVDGLIMSLPPRRQLIFRMNRLEGMRYSEIATALGVSEHTVQNHMVQAVKEIAAHLPRLRSTLEREGTQQTTLKPIVSLEKRSRSERRGTKSV